MRSFFPFFLFISLEINSISTRLADSQPELIPTLEILCIVDFETYVVHQKNDDNLRNYFFSFWKTVDHYFKLLENVKVHIKLTDVLIESERDRLKYVRLSRASTYYEKKAYDVLYVHDLMESMGKHFYSYKYKYPGHDVAILITQSRLCFEAARSLEECEAYTPFLTSTGRACSVNHNEKLVDSVGVIRDEGKYFRGIRRAVLTIGSLLGAGIDGSFGISGCKATDGYMMSPIVNFNFPYEFKWSGCSTHMMKAFLDPFSSRVACLFNKEPNSSLIDLSSAPLPGQLLTLDSFCRNLLGYKYLACHYDESVCSELVCSNDENECSTPVKGPALEGSWCGKDKRCLYGKCVPFPFSNKIKDNY